MKTKWTPGPWVSRDGPVFAVTANGKHVAITYDGLDMENDQDDSVCAANARLIAAAPELVESLTATLKLLRKAQDILTAYLHPDNYDDLQCINSMLELLDGPEQRAIETPARAILAKLEV